MGAAVMTRWTWWLAAASLLGWLGWQQQNARHHPWADLSRGHHTDHFSHMNAARAFPRVGLDLWRRGAQELFPAADARTLQSLPPDVAAGGSWTGGIYLVPGWPTEKPWVTSWSSKPRLYPPGDLLLVAPVAAAYHHTSMTLAQANLWLLALFLLVTHLAVWLALDLTRAATDRLLAWLCCALFCSEAIHWSLEGFYDAAAMVPLLLCASFLQQRRGLAALVAYCVAAFIHFRAFFLAPWALYAAWLCWTQKPWRNARAPVVAAAVAGLLCGGVSLFTFWLVTPTLGRQDINNALNIRLEHPAWVLLGVALGAVLVATALLARARAWLDAAVLWWLALVVVLVKEAYPWHILVPLAWLVAPVDVARPGSHGVVRGVRLAILVLVGVGLMRNPMGPRWMAEAAPWR